MRKFVTLLAACLLFAAMAIAQTRPITGQVRDEKGNPLPFATVKIKGSKTGVSADDQGNFKINTKSGDVLVASSTGTDPQEATVGSDGVINFSLKTNNAQLSEVVVTALGIKRQPKELGYSTTRVSQAELTQGKVTNIATGLTAKVSGLQINTVNNGINPTTRVTLRGNRSILGNNQALLVLDDVPLSISNLNAINPNDVDNVTVLKGASAAALYGSAASNGVIIVTTKKGTKGRPVIRFSNTTTFERISYMPKFQNEFGGFGGEGIGSPGTVLFPENPFVPYVPYENQSYGPRYNGQKVNIGGPVRIFRPDGTYFDSTATGIYAAKPNAKRDFFNTGVTVQNDISYSTGDDKSRFYLSAQDVTSSGIVPKDKNRRDAFRINGSRENGRFRADYAIGYTMTNTNTTPGAGVPSVTGPFAGANLFGGNTGGSYFQNRPVYWTVINTPANYDLRDYRNWQTDPFANPNGYFNAYYGNPWWQIDQARLLELNNDLLANIALNFKATDWLNLTARGGVTHNDYNAKYTRAGFTFADWAIADPLGAGNIPSAVKKLDPQEGDFFSVSNRVTGDFLASASKEFKDFTVKVIGGASIVDAYNNNAGIFSTSLVLPDFYNISNRNGQPNAFQNKTQTRTIGAFGDATIGYKEYLFLHGSVRNDWVSILSKQNRAFLYPAVDASFIFTDAFKELQNSKIISYGKLRAAYSQTAQVSIGPYSLENTFTAAAGFPYSVAGYTLNNTFSNPDIKPEFTTEKEVGLELGFLHNKIYFSAAYFDAVTTNQTIPISISSTTGYTGAVVNSGSMSNKGVELDLKFTPLLQTKYGLRWDIGINFAYIKNRVESIASGLTEVNVGGNSYAVVGKPYPTLRLTDWQRDSASGRIIVASSNGFPTPDPNLQYFGTTNPPLKLGLNTLLSWKGLTFTAVADYRSGATIFNAIGQSLDFTGVSWNSAQYGRQRFVIPNSVVKDGSGKYVPNTTVTTASGNNDFWASTWNQAQSPYVTSADFWKLREVSLSYELPKKWVGNTKAFRSIIVGIVGRNLLMWRPKENIWTDPEFSNTNGNGIGTTDINQTPPTRTYGASISVNF